MREQLRKTFFAFSMLTITAIAAWGCRETDSPAVSGPQTSAATAPVPISLKSEDAQKLISYYVTHLAKDAEETHLGDIAAASLPTVAYLGQKYDVMVIYYSWRITDSPSSGNRGTTVALMYQGDVLTHRSMCLNEIPKSAKYDAGEQALILMDSQGEEVRVSASDLVNEDTRVDQ